MMLLLPPVVVGMEPIARTVLSVGTSEEVVIPGEVAEVADARRRLSVGPSEEEGLEEVVESAMEQEVLGLGVFGLQEFLAVL